VILIVADQVSRKRWGLEYSSNNLKNATPIGIRSKIEDKAFALCADSFERANLIRIYLLEFQEYTIPLKQKEFGSAEIGRLVQDKFIPLVKANSRLQSVLTDKLAQLGAL
jgi:hypothetical protein